MTTSTDAAAPAAQPEALAPARGLGSRLWAITDVRWALGATGLFALGCAGWLLGAPAPLWWTALLACYAAGGWAPARDGLATLRRRVLDVDLLMIVAALAAAAVGQVVDGALLVVIFAASGALETVATTRTAESVRALLGLAPERATRLRRAGAAASAAGTEETVDTAALTAGDVILVRPGERIGADAVVLAGVSDVDQATMTGEPLPLPRGPGDELFAGTVNGAGALTARVTRPAAQSVLARIVAQVEQASATKARAQLLVEKAEQYYAVGVVAATLALFAVPLLAGAALRPTLLRAMTFMIVASPCAVVLATMPPLLSAIALAGRHGVLVRSAAAMERLAAVDLVAFDKTGTLTEGRPRVSSLAAASGCEAADVLRLAASAEHASEHPVGRAIVAEARQRGVALAAARDFVSMPGLGVAATVGGCQVTVANPSSLGDHPPGGAGGWASAAAERAREGGGTAVVVLVDGEPAGVIGLVDRVRPAAAASVAALARMTGTRPVLLTGDHPAAAARLAGALGLGAVHAGLLPQDKVARVRALRGTGAAGHRVLMAGDGVNDAPALAAADVGVAMGRRGADLALTAADLVLVHDDLAALPGALALARRARRLVAANLAIAGCCIAGLVAWDLAGHLPLPLGVAGHEGSTVLVGLNGLRLLRRGAWRRAVDDMRAARPPRPADAPRAAVPGGRRPRSPACRPALSAGGPHAARGRDGPRGRMATCGADGAHRVPGPPGKVVRMTDQAGAVLAALRRSHDLLEAAVAGLDGDALRGPSYASEWTIADVLSHLGSGAVIGKLGLDAAVAGTPAPAMADFQAVWDTWNAKTPEAQAADVLPADQALIDAYAAVPGEKLAALAMPLGPMRVDGVTMLRLRLSEHALHTWDVRVALDPAATVDPDAVAQLVDAVATMVGFLGKPTPTAATVRVVLADPARELALTIGETTALAPWEGGNADATLTAPAEAFLRLAYGRLDPEHTPGAVSADGVALDTLRAAFPGF